MKVGAFKNFGLENFELSHFQSKQILFQEMLQKTDSVAIFSNPLI